MVDKLKDCQLERIMNDLDVDDEVGGDGVGVDVDGE